MSRPPPKRSRRLSPLPLIMVGGWLLAGCVYVPLPRTLADGQSPDPEKLIGDVGSKKPIQPSLTTEAQVLHILGEPTRRSPDGRVLGYLFAYRGGAWVAPFFLTGRREHVDHAVRLEFDAGGVLARWQARRAARVAGIFGSSGLPQHEISSFLDQVAPAHRPPGTSQSPGRHEAAP